MLKEVNTQFIFEERVSEGSLKPSYCMLKEVNTQFIFKEGVSEGLSFIIYEETMLLLKYVKFFHMNMWITIISNHLALHFANTQMY